jgi:hypothetical protein
MPNMKIKPQTDDETIPTSLRIKINKDLSPAVACVGGVGLKVRGAVLDTVHKAVLVKIPTSAK